MNGDCPKPSSRYWHYDFVQNGRRFHGSTGVETRRKAEAVERKRREEAALGLLDDRTGRIDVVLTADGGRSVAIEIDTTWKRRSIEKLTHISDTHLPVWIFLGTREVPHIPVGHPIAKIHLLRVDPSRIQQLPATAAWRRRLAEVAPRPARFCSVS